MISDDEAWMKLYRERLEEDPVVREERRALKRILRLSKRLEDKVVGYEGVELLREISTQAKTLLGQEDCDE